MFNFIKKYLPKILLNFVILDFVIFIYIFIGYSINENNGINGLIDFLLISIFVFVIYQPAIFFCDLIAYLLSLFIFKKVFRFGSEKFIFLVGIILGGALILMTTLPPRGF